MSVNGSPIRTRREIVPGVYGAVRVSCDYDGARQFELHKSKLNAEELREAAHTLNQIAEVLGDE